MMMLAMNSLTLKFWSDIRSSYYFLPAILVVVAIPAASGLLWLDSRVGPGLFEGLPGLRFDQADAARDVISTIAGSIMTVASIAFSMTLVAVSHASTQFGPRLVENFMRDRGNQWSLGIFVSTFIFCLLVLAAIHGPVEVAGQSDREAFVPNLSIVATLLLALVNVGVLIYYIHHVAESIRLSTIIAGVAADLHAALDRRFPSGIGEPLDDDEVHRSVNQNHRDLLKDHAVNITAIRSGFVQTVDGDSLLETAREHGLTVKLLRRPGQFVSIGTTLAKVVPADRATDEVIETIQRQIAFGIHRTQDQNALFLAEQLAEVATRALSPGVNDPRTATDCLHWLHSVLFSLRDEADPLDERHDGEGRLLLVANPVTYEDFAAIAFDDLRPYFSSDENARESMAACLRHLIDHTPDQDRCNLLRRYQRQLDNCDGDSTSV